MPFAENSLCAEPGLNGAGTRQASTKEAEQEALRTSEIAGLERDLDGSGKAAMIKRMRCPLEAIMMYG